MSQESRQFYKHIFTSNLDVSYIRKLVRLLDSSEAIEISSIRIDNCCKIKIFQNWNKAEDRLLDTIIQWLYTLSKAI